MRKPLYGGGGQASMHMSLTSIAYVASTVLVWRKVLYMLRFDATAHQKASRAGSHYYTFLDNTIKKNFIAVPEIILRGVGRRHFFVLWGKGVLLTCPRGGGNFSWGGGVKAYLIHSGAGLIKALTCPAWGSGDSGSMCVLGVEGSEKKCSPPPWG